MRLELSHFIESDLDDIADHIAQDNPLRAVTFIKDIRTKFSTSPITQLRPDIGYGARMAIAGSYAILFRVIG